LPYVCLALIAISFGLRCIYADSDLGDSFLYTLTPFRIEPLVAGSLAAVLLRSERIYSTLKASPLLLGVATCGAAMLATVIFAGQTTEFAHAPMATFGYTSFALIFVSLVLYADVYSGSPSWLAEALRKPWLRSFGKYSYAIYVFHLPIFLVYGMAVPRALIALPEQWRFSVWLLSLAIGFGLTYATAVISWHLVEKRFLRLKRRFAVRY